MGETDVVIPPDKVTNLHVEANLSRVFFRALNTGVDVLHIGAYDVDDIPDPFRARNLALGETGKFTSASDCPLRVLSVSVGGSVVLWPTLPW